MATWCATQMMDWEGVLTVMTAVEGLAAALLARLGAGVDAGGNIAEDGGAVAEPLARAACFYHNSTWIYFLIKRHSVDIKIAD